MILAIDENLPDRKYGVFLVSRLVSSNVFVSPNRTPEINQTAYPASQQTNVRFFYSQGISWLPELALNNRSHKEDSLRFFET